MEKAIEPTYDELKKFFAYYSARYLISSNISPELRPIACLEQLERESKKKALNSLKLGIAECIAMSSRFSSDEVRALDKELRDQGVITLSALRRRFSKKYANILKRGKIKNDSEFYLLRNVLDDTANLPAEEIEVITTLLDAYEGM